MSYTIAITGKGGCGKTTIAGLLIWSLTKNGHAPVLAVDADPNSCLDVVLGVEVEKSIGTVREEALDSASKGLVTGITKKELLELKIAESLVEAEDFDLVAMGRPEGPGCYCYANNVLRDVIGELAQSYPYIVIDNEAGLENLSRRIVSKIDLLVLVGDPSKNGVRAIQRLYDLAGEMKVEYKKIAIIINRLYHDTIPEEISTFAEEIKADFLLAIPEDGTIGEWGERGESLRTLSGKNEVVRKIDEFIGDEKIGIG
ncbi:MAG: AAA family ATPase [bacterium]|nr:AAA family ATPase [bacterium]